ncbi:uncharacterized protein LOC121698642 isoform X2 [Alosa sapidissima]|uniref:uncharacterized protein LOC121698642 isoform X2 n=1 Tax=Alosa sapidissima TaxID=34773 RepID=UPI001C09C364|nr:uncharacterized protein LOC121698642 isoform X2 [Alosa sapidissima]
MGATVVEGEPHGGVGLPSYIHSLEFSGLEWQTDAMVMDQKNPFKALMDEKKVQGPNKEKCLLGMKVWLQTQIGTQRLGQHLPQLTSTVPLAEEAAVAVAVAACPPVVDDGWTSFMFSTIHRMVSEENGRAELWATVLQFKEQALVQEAQAKLDLLSCQPRCGEEAGQDPLTESFRVTSQLMHQQAQMKKITQAIQAASEDRKLLLKHLTDLETQRASIIQLQKQAEAYRKAAGQDTKVLHTEVQDAEDQTFEHDLSLKVAMGEHQEMADKSSYNSVKYEEISTKCARNGALRTPQCEVASNDATVMPDDMEDSDPQYKDDFESDEGEVEDEAETCSSFSSTDDCAEFLFTDSAVSGAEETLGHNPLRKETPRGSVLSDQQSLVKRNREDQAGPSKVRAQDQTSWSGKAGQAWSKFHSKLCRIRSKRYQWRNTSGMTKTERPTM